MQCKTSAFRKLVWRCILTEITSAEQAVWSTDLSPRLLTQNSWQGGWTSLLASLHGTGLVSNGIWWSTYRFDSRRDSFPQIPCIIPKKKFKMLLSNQPFATGRHQKVCSDAIFNSLGALKYSFYAYWVRRTKLLSSRQHNCHNTTSSSLSAPFNTVLGKLLHFSALGSFSQKWVLQFYFLNSCIFDEHM